MKRKINTGILLTVIAVLSIGVAAEASSEPTIQIDVAPNTLNLESNGNGVTVHTDIIFTEEDCDFVTLKVEGKEILKRSCFSDDCGDLVVKVDRENVVGVIKDDEDSPTRATFTLIYSPPNSESFTGIDTIDVIDVGQSDSQK